MRRIWSFIALRTVKVKALSRLSYYAASKAGYFSH